MHRLNHQFLTLWALEVKDSVIISEEVDLIDAKRMCSHLLDDGLDDLITTNCCLTHYFNLSAL